MPILSGLLLMLFDFLVKVFLKFFDIKKAWVLAIVAITLGLLFATYSLVMTCINSCVPSAPLGSTLGPFFKMGWGLVFNGVTMISISCWLAVATGASLYVWKKKILDQLIKMV
ncbi:MULTISPECIES: hypothetical protein [unclassified Cupriavidus]|uniref:hypothetical protein n=1 Tax=unclassified Cupriavidus TaxID=2640874 RepID=UPI001C0013D7|nr:MULTISPECIES: hypothetical protein [unclassified Cupriavidus]MCA3187163.1 hypothetical protein [Cupriavidus sp.]MCA3189219.1 hypothetical protein [Cupriavidus sp.]MCA3195299.1 hypothetical protein [Cupriavidus sp.]MCA3200854.1 hypothetical protein [Cupriavidus sp.]MCA3230948.1 hypothetical protein [Cupriavidus sp.]